VTKSAAALICISFRFEHEVVFLSKFFILIEIFDKMIRLRIDNFNGNTADTYWSEDLLNYPFPKGLAQMLDPRY
jgi:hypothetical protein